MKFSNLAKSYSNFQKITTHFFLVVWEKASAFGRLHRTGILYSPEDCRLRWLNDLFYAGGEWVTAVGQDWGHWLENYKQSHNFGWRKVNLDSRQSQRFRSDERKKPHFPCVKANTVQEHRLDGQRLSCSWAWCADCPCVVRVQLLMSGTCLEKQKCLSGNRTLNCRDGRSLQWLGSFCPKRLSPGRVMVTACSAWRPAAGVFLSLALCSITLSLNKTLLLHRHLYMLFILHGGHVAPLSLMPSVFLYCLGMFSSW